MTGLNPYEILDVPRTADCETIRRAYRRKAKTAHPDGGGTSKKFALIKLAHDVLTDDGRRAKYDATGNLDPSEPDNALSDVLNIIMGALDNAIRSCEASNEKPEQRDLLPLMRQAINKGTQELNQRRETLKEAKKKIENLRSRFTTKKSAVNFIENMITQGLNNIEPQIQQLDRFDIAAKAAIKMLEDYKFRSDPKPEPDLYTSRLAAFSRI